MNLATARRGLVSLSSELSLEAEDHKESRFYDTLQPGFIEVGLSPHLPKVGVGKPTTHLGQELSRRGTGSRPEIVLFYHFCDHGSWRPRIGASVQTYKDVAPTGHRTIAKTDRQNEVAPPSRVGKATQQARQEKDLSHRDCARKINGKTSVLQVYKFGKAIQNIRILTRLSLSWV
ncbi:hypothetical protein BJ322DRAFT_1021329 [Thelephora terrestris]|uniref:Uncharacterized protein n=1 Tax=Thelephora terrestris TaxID=56493 RepID=A0A9P6HF64_9AGAM|nr:hypothetical protein BJ322DRAFT_1021329 [Thelephora terrestris]